jgi:DNA gyrase/topoisomerase IV subunit A
MVISQFGKIIRIDPKSIRAAGRGTQGVKLLDLNQTTIGGPSRLRVRVRTPLTLPNQTQ